MGLLELEEGRARRLLPLGRADAERLLRLREGLPRLLEVRRRLAASVLYGRCLAFFFAYSGLRRQITNGGTHLAMWRDILSGTLAEMCHLWQK